MAEHVDPAVLLGVQTFERHVNDKVLPHLLPGVSREMPLTLREWLGEFIHGVSTAVRQHIHTTYQHPTGDKPALGVASAVLDVEDHLGKVLSGLMPSKNREETVTLGQVLGALIRDVSLAMREYIWRTYEHPEETPPS